jgi:AcrR family transcriptional regulator
VTAQVITRSLSPAQAATRRKLVDAAIALASSGGYEAVGMRELAARAGVSHATAYQYFTSKDHVLVDALLELVQQTTDAVRARPARRHRSVADRAAATMRRAVQRLEHEPELYVALTRAYISGSPEVGHARPALERAMRAWVTAALEGSDIDDQEGVVEVLEAVLFANMVGLVTGGRSPTDVGPALERAVRTVLRGVRRARPAPAPPARAGR